MKYDREIHVAVVVEAGCENRTEYPQLCDLVHAAQGGDGFHIGFYQLHVAKIVNRI